jgi:hypothetical protein
MMTKAGIADALSPGAKGGDASAWSPSVAAGDEVDELRRRNKDLESQLSHQITALKREQESLLKMVAGMGTGPYYGYDRRAVRSKATKKIADDLRLAGVPLDEGTILKLLRRPSELLPAEDFTAWRRSGARRSMPTTVA